MCDRVCVFKGEGRGDVGMVHRLGKKDRLERGDTLYWHRSPQYSES